MSSTLLKEKALPKVLWVKIAICSVYLLNKCLTKSLVNKTPYEALSGFKPSVTHLRIFEYIACVQVLGARRIKLDEHG